MWFDCPAKKKVLLHYKYKEYYRAILVFKGKKINIWRSQHFHV